MLGVGTGDLYMEMFYNEQQSFRLGTGDWGVTAGHWRLIHGDVLQ